MDQKTEFKNVSGGRLGYSYYNEDGRLAGDTVAHGDTVWLSERDQIATANAPRRPEDNPLANGALVEVTAPTEIKNRRPLRPVAPVEEKAVEGTNAPDEEVATPQAKKAPKQPTNAEVAAQRAQAAPEAPAKPARASAKAPEGKRPAAEEVATPKPAEQSG